jgi:hypothetical protein
MASVGTGELRQLLVHLYQMSRVERYCPLLVWGEAGVGKSESVRSAADHLGIDFVDLRLGNMDAPDLMGLMRDEIVYPCLFDLQDPDAGPVVRAERWSKNGLWNHCKIKHKDKIPAALTNKPIEFCDWLIEQTEKAGYGVYFESRTVYSAPGWFPSPDTQGILFLDELNRSPRETLQGVFQLILDRRIHELELPPGWIIVSANNPPRDSTQGDGLGYDVTNITDKAFWDRFCHVVLMTTQSEWLEYAAKAGVDQTIRILISGDSSGSVLGLKHGTEIPFLEPTPRSWETLSRLLKPVQIPGEGTWELSRDLKLAVCQGKVGGEVGSQFMAWMEQTQSESIGSTLASAEVQLETVTDLINDALYVDPDQMGEAVKEAGGTIGLLGRNGLEDLMGKYAEIWRSTDFVSAIGSSIGRFAEADVRNGLNWLAKWYGVAA